MREMRSPSRLISTLILPWVCAESDAEDEAVAGAEMTGANFDGAPPAGADSLDRSAGAKGMKSPAMLFVVFHAQKDGHPAVSFVRAIRVGHRLRVRKA